MRIVKRTIFWVLCIAALAAILGSSWLAWETRRAAIPNIYQAAGVWGTSTLVLRPDHTFTQEVQFMEYDRPSVAPYPRQVTLHKTISGRWEEYGRSIALSSIRTLASSPSFLHFFISLYQRDQGEAHEVFLGSFGPVALTGLGIEIDIGRGIVYRKKVRRTSDPDQK
ncbi:MAG TPA: hypothetical protein VMU26_24695 [Candidatus Polarisedimenticolia bacterium]|nr:hypothetical protein [Candidatus Polarisedimenticolia bacterium]